MMVTVAATIGWVALTRLLVMAMTPEDQFLKQKKQQETSHNRQANATHAARAGAVDGGWNES
jgi:hypothetical protein